MNIESVIRDANPVNSADLPGADAPEARWLLHGITQVPVSEHWSARPRRRPRGLVLTVAAGAATAAAGVTALAVGLLSGPAGTALPGAASGHPSAATVAALHKLSRVAARQSAAAPAGARPVPVHVLGGDQPVLHGGQRAVLLRELQGPAGDLDRPGRIRPDPRDRDGPGLPHRQGQAAVARDGKEGAAAGGPALGRAVRPGRAGPTARSTCRSCPPTRPSWPR